jgi:imidazolonepropionase-like amidohydrolase
MRVAWDGENLLWREIKSFGVAKGHFVDLELGSASLGYDATSAAVYFVPGLIDLHTHIAIDSRRRVASTESVEQFACEPIEETAHRVAKRLQACLRSGITTVCDLGWYGARSLALAKELERLRCKNIPLPRIFTSGGFITRPGGHAEDFGITVDTLDELLQCATDLIDGGAHLIKVMNDPIIFSVAELTKLKELCSSRGALLWAHVFRDRSAVVALDAGVDTLAHAGDYSQETLLRLATSRTFVISTFVAALDTVADPWGTRADDLLCDTCPELFESWYESCCASLPEMYARGVRIVCGTDAGFPGTPLDSLPREICALNNLGIPIAVALNCATWEAGSALGKRGKLGQIRSGALADYSVYDRNPLVGEGRLRNPKRVFVGGEKLFSAQ